MSPEQQIICKLEELGLSIRADGDSLVVSPGGRLTDDLRYLIKANRAELLVFLRDADRLAGELIKAAMRVCDRHADSGEARAQMRADCLATPAHLRADLLDHFRQTYGSRP